MCDREEIRTPDRLLRRQMLYPAELTAQVGADEGNRTPLSSLEGWHSTNELHPHNARIIISKENGFVNNKNALI